MWALCTVLICAIFMYLWMDKIDHFTVCCVRKFHWHLFRFGFAFMRWFLFSSHLSLLLNHSTISIEKRTEQLLFDLHQLLLTRRKRMGNKRTFTHTLPHAHRNRTHQISKSLTNWQIGQKAYIHKINKQMKHEWSSINLLRLQKIIYIIFVNLVLFF